MSKVVDDLNKSRTDFEYDLDALMDYVEKLESEIEELRQEVSDLQDEFRDYEE